MSSKKLSFLLGAILTLVGYLFGYNQKSSVRLSQNTPVPSQFPGNQVTRVIDGDTIEIDGITKIRYIGIDTPETVDPKKAFDCFGNESSDKNKELVLGKVVKLEKDVSETDNFGRLLRYVYVGDEMINDKLVRDGYARVSTYPPDVKYQERFLESERYARENSLGLWGECGE